LSQFGIGTERVEAEVRQRFPAARVARLDSDSVHSIADYEEIFGLFADGETDLLVGTQMLAKGHDFPNVTLVGVISADVALNLPDFRASERTFQLLGQVGGRAGRGSKLGRVIVQTASPEHPAIQAALTHDVDGFLMSELQVRQQIGFPPVGRLARVVASGPVEDEVRDQIGSLARDVMRAMDTEVQVNGLRLMGPSEAPLKQIRGRYRHHAFFLAPKAATLMRAVAQIRLFKPRRGVSIALDVDPVDNL
jgi:primosomal protein N' (replication factor Y)